MTTLYLLRHAESAYCSKISENEWPLSKYGLEQSKLLITDLEKLSIDAIYSSPYKRAIQTVVPFTSKHKLEINIDNRLREKKLTNEWLDDHSHAIKKAWDDFSFCMDGGGNHIKTAKKE